LVGAAFIFSIVIILLIFDSNSKTLQQKLNAGKTQVQNSNQSTDQPSMDMMRQIQKLKDAWNDNPRSYDANVQLGNAYFDISQFQRATFYYKNANLDKPGQPSVLIDLGVSYFNINKPDSALLFIEEALEVDPNHIYGLYNAGIIYYNVGQVDRAILVWQQLISSHSESREAQAAKEFIKQIESQRNKS